MNCVFASSTSFLSKSNFLREHVWIKHMDAAEGWNAQEFNTDHVCEAAVEL